MYQERFCGKTGPRTIFTIDAKCGYKIELFSDLGPEAEVLFPPLTKLQVTNSMKHCDPLCIADNDAGLPDQICLKQVDAGAVPSASSPPPPLAKAKSVFFAAAAIAVLLAIYFGGGGSTTAPIPSDGALRNDISLQGTYLRKEHRIN
jgi:hypothetical protein